MTAGRIAAKKASMQRLGKTKRPVLKKDSEGYVPGWYSTISVPAEQRDAVAALLVRRGATDLAPMLDVTVLA